MNAEKKNGQGEPKESKMPGDWLGIILSVAVVVIGLAVAYELAGAAHISPGGTVCLANGDIPAYRVLEPRDVQAYNMSDIAGLKGVPAYIGLILGGDYYNNSTIEGKYYTLAPVNDSQAITKKMLRKLPDGVVNDTYIQHNLYDVVGVPVQASTALGGTLRPGDIVDVGLIQANTSLTVPYKGLLLLDIVNQTGGQYLFVLALNRTAPDQSVAGDFYLNMKNASMNLVTRNMTAQAV